MELVRLFVEGKHEVKSREGKTQGDPTLLGAYTLELTSLIHFLSDFFYQRTQKQRNCICRRFDSCTRSKQDQSILG